MGLEFLNSNKAAEMAEILKNIHHNFVPKTEVCNQTEVLQKVFLDGDQLTEERARNAQLANTLADTSYERLSGLETAFADWHLGKNLLMVSIQSQHVNNIITFSSKISCLCVY